jgi:hypothetical protein
VAMEYPDEKRAKLGSRAIKPAEDG